MGLLQSSGRRDTEGRRKRLAPCASLLGSSNCAGRLGLSAPQAPLSLLPAPAEPPIPVLLPCPPGPVGAAGMTDVLPQPDCSLKAVCEPLERCCLDQLEEPGGKRPPNTGARLWGRVRSKLLRQKVLEGTGGGRKGGLEGLREGWGLWGLRSPVSAELLACCCLTADPGTELRAACRSAQCGLNLVIKADC